jgi:hypothetical protein
MQEWVKEEVRRIARELQAQGEKPYDGFIVNPMNVYMTMENSGTSKALAHLRRHRPGVDPYQLLKAWMPRLSG